MSWPRPSRSGLFAAIALAALALSGCTITPVHGDRAMTGISEVQLAYAKPANRLEQVFYQALAARLGTSPSGPTLTASVSTSASRIGLTDFARTAVDHQVIATVSYRVERDGETLASGTRTATSGYRTTGQILADDTARQNAGEEAVRAAAQSVIATLLSEPGLR